MANDLFPEIPVSRFDPFMNKDQKWVPGIKATKDDLYKQLHNFKDGFYAKSIDHLRALKEKKQRDTYKQEKLPAFTFSAFIEGHRKRENIKGHTGILVIDIDEEGFLPYLKKRREQDPDYSIANFRDEVSRETDDGFSNILFAGLSASGTGLFLMFLIDPAQHLDCFFAIEWELQQLYGIKIDPSCKDETRLRFCTYDPDAIIRPINKVAIYQPPPEYIEWKEVQERRLKDLKLKPQTFTSSANAASSIINNAMRMIERAEPGTRHNTILKAARLIGGYVATGVIDLDFARGQLRSAVEHKRATSGDLDLNTEYKAVDDGLSHGQLSPIHLHVIAPDDPQYEHFSQLEEENQRNFKDFYIEILKHNKAGIPFADIDFDPLCRTFGIDVDRAQAIASRLYRLNSDEHDWDNLVPSIKLKIFISKRWELRRNVVTSDIFIRVRNSGNAWKKIRIEDLWLSICEQRFKFNYEDLTRLLNTEMVQEYNPFVDYFKKVHKLYDGHTDYIKILADCIEVFGIDKSFFYEMFKKMLIRSVKCALEEQYVNRFVFVFASVQQNTGKSWLIRWLSPWGMDNYYAENPLGDSKDDRIRMSEVFIYNLEELQSLNKKDVNVLKAIISSGSSKERRPYEKLSQTFHRRCSFFGSTNRTDFLIDDSNTRWLIFETGNIDWSYRDKINVANLWAQVYDLYLNQYPYELNKNELAVQESMNLRFVEVSSEETLLERFFVPCDPEHRQAKLMTTTDIVRRLQELCNNPKLNVNIQSVGRALKRQKFVIKYVNKIRTFAVIPINQNPDACDDARTYLVSNADIDEKYDTISKLWSNDNSARRSTENEPPF